MKRIICLLISACILMSLTVIPAYAEDISLSDFKITLSDASYSASLNQDGEFEVSVPKGHPKLPKILCEDQNAEIYQPYIPTYEKEGYGKVITNGKTVMIKFVKSGSDFVLQFDDRYDYNFGSGDFAVSSSDASIVSVENKTLIAKKVSDTPVTITSKNGKKLIVNKVEKAPLNVFLIAGQSNSFGADCTTPGHTDATVCDDGTVYTYAHTKYYSQYISQSPDLSRFDMCFGTMNTNSSNRGYGYPPALGKTWYDLTGEKVLFVLAARGSTSSAEWQPDFVETKEYPNWYPENADGKTMTVPLCNLYTNAVNRFNEAISDFEKGSNATSYVNSDNFEIVKKGYFWYQGENDIQASVSKDTYLNNMTVIHNGFKNDLGVEFCGDIVPRYCNNPKDDSDRLDGTRLAQYELHKTVKDFNIVSNEPEVMTTSDMNVNSWTMIHHSQETYNEVGIDAAENLFGILSATSDRAVKDIKLYYDSTLFKVNEDKLTINDPETHNYLLLASPLYAKDKNVEITEVLGNSIKLSKDYSNGADTISFVNGSEKTDSITVKAGGFEKTFNFANGYKKDDIKASYYDGNNTVSLSGYLGNKVIGNGTVTVFYVKKDYALQENLDSESVDHIGIIDVLPDNTYYYTFETDTNPADYKFIIKEGSNDITDTLKTTSVSNGYLFDVSLKMDRKSLSTYYQKDGNIPSDTFGNAVVTIKNPHKANIETSLVFAFYAKDGTLISTSIQNIETNGEETVTKEEKVPGRARKVKAFILDGSGSLRPCSNFDIMER